MKRHTPSPIAHIRRLTDLGAARYLTKPLDVNGFFKLVDRLLGDR